jgi:hypothetical protein
MIYLTPAPVADASQGTLRQWAPIGAILSFMWILPQIKLGLSAGHIIGSCLATWALSCCVAAGLEVRMRLSYLQQQGHMPPLQQQT